MKVSRIGLAGLLSTTLITGAFVFAPSAAASAANVQCNSFVLYRGWDGSCVGHLQTLLRGPGNVSSSVWTANLATDGSFGPLTENAVKKFQRGMKIQVDGRFGPQSWRTMCGIGSGGGGSPTPSQRAWQRAYLASC
ncbi:MAG: peptidoglycan-binding domain-containing protein [Angustibacter sp.]